jgi:hypothetical protein
LGEYSGFKFSITIFGESVDVCVDVRRVAGVGYLFGTYFSIFFFLPGFFADSFIFSVQQFCIERRVDWERGECTCGGCGGEGVRALPVRVCRVEKVEWVWSVGTRDKGRGQLESSDCGMDGVDEDER